ncbi:hypothetical protein [Rhodoligotrophos defluvii]|uniref:hypothetical protein n=1 Tax=Rhodoligotrophos defluvii TaxID=2561934 RepID=UPI0010C99D32|nr:hypothetical protein [Rhodoligotrophos defluvii]
MTVTTMLSLEEQRALVGQIRDLAARLEQGADPFLAGHILHLRERAEVLLEILEIAPSAVMPALPGEVS